MHSPKQETKTSDQLLVIAEKLLNSYFATIPRKKPSIQKINGAKLIAHRGAHNNKAGIYENTMEAFRLAKNAGCWGVELDVHLTADAVPVVIHDPTLKRLWKQKKAISELTFKTLRTLVPQIPSLAEVAEEFGSSLHLFIELKTVLQDESVLIEALKNVSAVKDYHLLTLDPAHFEPLSQFPKASLILVALHNNVKAFCDLSIKKQYGGVMGSYLLLTDAYISRLAQAHQTAGVGFVDSKNSLKREIHREIAWIFTNQAVKMGDYLRELHV